MGSQLHGLPGTVAGHVGNDGQLALGNFHDVLQQQLPLGNGLVNALAGGTAHVQALDTLIDVILGQLANSLGGNIALFIVASVERRNNTGVFGQIFHFSYSFSFARGCSITLSLRTSDRCHYSALRAGFAGCAMYVTAVTAVWQSPS